MKKILFILPVIIFSSYAQAQKLDSLLPVRGFCIAAPPPAGLDSFVTFIEKELAVQRRLIMPNILERKHQIAAF